MLALKSSTPTSRQLLNGYHCDSNEMLICGGLLAFSEKKKFHWSENIFSLFALHQQIVSKANKTKAKFLRSGDELRVYQAVVYYVEDFLKSS